MDALAAEALPTLQDFSWQNLANIAWSFAVLDLTDEPLLDALSAESIPRISLQCGQCPPTTSGVLGLAWALAFSHRLSSDAFATFTTAVRRLGRDVDTRNALAACSECRRGDGDVSWIRTRQGIKPSLPIDLRGIVTIFKPTDWEVDGLVVEGEDHPPLSAYMQSVFPKNAFPLVYNAEQNYGFLHRLDIPSSGLVLGGTSFEGYFYLRLQLDTHVVRREYVVVCRDHPPADLSEVIARVDMAPDPSQRKSISDAGKPSRTQVCLEAHIKGRSDPGEGGACIVAVRIFTGRRHQIRAHMRFSNHPSIADARYTAKSIIVIGKMVLLGASVLWQSKGNIVAAEMLLEGPVGRRSRGGQMEPRHTTYH